MKTKYKKLNRLLLLAIFLASFAQSFGQTTIHQESFEAAPSASTYSADTEFGTSDPNDYWHRLEITGNGKDEIDSGVTGGDGTYMYAGEDTDGNTNPNVLTLVSVDVSAYSDIKVQLAIGSGEQIKYDSGDYIEIYVTKDGGSEELIGAFYGYDHVNNDATNGKMYQDTDLDGTTSDDSSVELSKTMTDFTFDVTGTISDLVVIVKMGTTSGDEVVMVDNIRILGTAPSGTSTLTAGGGTEPATISSLTNTSGAASLNFDFTFNEGDGSAAGFSQLVFNQSTDDAFTDWTEAIAGAELSDGTNSTTSVTIGSSSLTFASLAYASSGDIGYIAANGNKTYTLKIWLKSALGGTLPATIDGKDFVFEVTNSSLTMENGGLAASQLVSSGNDKNVVDVTPTKIRYIQQPTDVDVGDAISPAVTIELADANNNRDLDYASLATIRITASGASLDSSPVDATLDASGLATFSSLTFSTDGTGVTLTAEDIDDIIGTSNETQVSDAFNVNAVPVITVSDASLSDFGNQCINTSSGEASYTVTGSDLTDDITVTAPTHFEISTTSGGTFTSSLTLTQSSGSVNQTIYVRFKPSSTGAKSGNITHTSTDATQKDVSVSGTGVTVPSITTTIAASSITTTTASSGGQTLSDGGEAITNKGVCWNTATSPTTANSNTDDGTGTADFTSSITGLSSNTQYYVRAYATNACGTSYAGEINFTTLKDEPADYPSNFACNTNITAYTMDITWTDASSTTTPDGYLLKWNTSYGAIADPVDGTEEADDEATTGSGVKNIAQGTGNYTVNNLNPSTDYYFKIWSYTNSGSDINYKLVSEPQTSCTTIAGPTVLYSGSFEDGDEAWTYYDDGGTSDWERATDGSYGPGDLGHDGTYYAYFYGWNSDADDWLISPAYDFAGYSSITFDFWSWSRNDPHGTLTMKVSSDYSGDPTTATWTDYTPTYDDGSKTWTASGDVDLSAFDNTSNVYIAFYYTGTDVDRNWAIDDYTVKGTLSSNTDETSEALAPGTQGSASQVASATIYSTQTASGSAESVFNFEIYDDGAADGEITDVTQITIRNNNPTNGADWTDNIQGVVLYNQTASSDVTIGSVTITDNDITIPIGTGDLTITDGGYVDLTLKIYLNTSNIEDGKKLQFMIDADNHGFKAVVATSRFANPFTADITSNIHTIAVDATKLIFSDSEPPSSGIVNQNLQITVYAVDDNGNIDIDNTSSVTLAKDSGSGNMTATTGLTQNLSNGTYTWTASFSDSDTYKVSATTSGLSTSNTVTSNDIKITNIFKFQGFDNATRDNWTYTGDGSVSSGDVSTNTITIHPYNGSGDKNAGDGNSWAMIRSDVFVMDNVDLTNYTNVNFSFKYAGKDVNSGDELKLRVSYDGGTTWKKVEPYTDSGSYPEGGDFLADGDSGADWDFDDTNNPTSGPFYPDNPFVFAIDDSNTGFMAEFTTGQYYFLDEIQLEGVYQPLTINTLNFMGATQTSVTVNAFLEYLGGENVTERGIVLSTSSNPTTSDTKIADSGTGLGYYSADFTGLTSNTTYYVRAYVISDESGTVYANELSFTTCDGIGECLNDKDLIISEYIESSCGGTNNAIEIFNGTGCTVNLKHYRLQHDNAGSYEDYSNSIFDFPDFDLPNNQTYVITNSGSNAPEFDLKANGGQADIQDNVASLSGDEQIQLLKTTDNYNNYAVIEHVGNQSNWGEEKTFARNPDITDPRVRAAVGDDTCDPNTNGEWILYPDCYYDDLGYHRVGFEWEGDIDSDWYNTNNWNINRVPTRSSTATIPDVVTAGTGVFPVIEEYSTVPTRVAECYKLVIESGASVTINPDGLMAVTGSIGNATGVTGLNIKSDATGTGSLILAGGACEATVERYITGGEWHAVSPTTDAVPYDKYVIGSTDYLYYYDESADDFWNTTTNFDFNGIIDANNYDENVYPSGWQKVSSGNLSSTTGYFYKTPTTQTLILDGGDLFTDDYTVSTSYTDHSTLDWGGGAGVLPTAGEFTDCADNWGEYDGWILVSNPYACAINWAIMLADDDLENAIYLWDGTNSNYKYFLNGATAHVAIGSGYTNDGETDSVQYILPGQAFFVKATNSGSDNKFTIPKTMRVHNFSHGFLRCASKAPEETEIENLLRIRITKDGFSDETVIWNTGGATDGFDGAYDIRKRFSMNNSVPQLYTFNEFGNRFALNSFSELTEHKIIPFGLYVTESGEYTLNMTENTFRNVHAWLEDRTLGTTTMLNNPTTYTFTQTAESNKDRFFLHFNPNTAPIVNASIEDQVTQVNDLYVYNAPAGLFSDVDFGDKITITATLADGSALPEWLTFDAATMTFSGTPTDIDILDIRLTATDIFGETANEDYKLSINSATTAGDIIKAITIYPNPINDYINITSPENGTYKIYTIDGKFIAEGILANHETSLNTSSWANGIYIIEINTVSQTYKHRIVKQ